MKVVLISASTYEEPHAVYPIGPDYVAGAIASDHEVLVLDANDLSGEGELEKAIAAFGPDVAGLSLRNVDNTLVTGSASFIDGFRELAARVRTATNAPLVLGGAGFTLFPLPMMQEMGADYGIVGEGERLADLLTALAEGRDPASVPGVVLPGKAVERPGPLSAAPRRVHPTAGGHAGYYLSKGGILNLQSKRGCPFGCIYCTYPSIEGRRLRRFDPAQVGQDAKRLQEAGARFLFITDSVFNADEAHSAEVASAIAAAGVTVPWGAFFVPRKPSPGYYETLAKSGCTHVEFGTESLSEKMLAAYCKPFGAGEAIAAHQAAMAAGLNVAHYFLLGGPGEDRETLGETLDGIEKLTGGVFFFFCGIRIFPGTRLHRIALEQGIVKEDDDLLEPVFYQSAKINAAEIEAEVQRCAVGRGNWIVGEAAARIARVTRRMYKLGHAGLLWEKLGK